MTAGNMNRWLLGSEIQLILGTAGIPGVVVGRAADDCIGGWVRGLGL